jgi:hypothetical protein
MKHTTLVALALIAGGYANAQSDTTRLPETDTTVVTMIDTSVGNAYVSNPDRLRAKTTESLTNADIFPALGTFQGTENETVAVNITLDEENKGMVWVEGLPQGRFKAVMKKAPSTYKIPAQKSESGVAIAEGSLHVNPETNELTILVGRSYDEKNPTGFLTVAANKKTGWKFSGKKAEAEATIAPEAPVKNEE